MPDLEDSTDSQKLSQEVCIYSYIWNDYVQVKIREHKYNTGRYIHLVCNYVERYILAILDNVIFVILGYCSTDKIGRNIQVEQTWCDLNGT